MQPAKSYADIARAPPKQPNTNTKTTNNTRKNTGNKQTQPIPKILKRGEPIPKEDCTLFDYITISEKKPKPKS